MTRPKRIRVESCLERVRRLGVEKCGCKDTFGRLCAVHDLHVRDAEGRVVVRLGSVTQLDGHQARRLAREINKLLDMQDGIVERRVLSEVVSDIPERVADAVFEQLTGHPRSDDPTIPDRPWLRPEDVPMPVPTSDTRRKK